MYPTPVRPQGSPGAPRPAGRFPSPGPCWGYPRDRSPYGGSGHRGFSPRAQPYSPGSPGSPGYSPGPYREYRDRSPGGFGNGSRGFGGPMRYRDGFRRPQSFSPASNRNFQSGSSDAPVEKYFSPSMLQDPWKTLQPVCHRSSSSSKEKDMIIND
ncbi:M-phase-specific PLK1-interacting protein [Brachyistius frenatus]|uniref:M-phase-specific PLK1-interacting protein n=1 Tax=Brachyistius frenatus TaxID=100188 RepID=UPI0037E6F791